MAVHYKFKSAKDYDTIQFEGSVISVGDLKQRIIEQKKLDKAKDFDLKFSNVESKEEYIKDDTMIPKNTSIVVRRVPIARAFHSQISTTDDGKSANVYRGYPPLARTSNDTRAPPSTYICHRCGSPGHYIKNCPTNVDPNFDKVKKSTGIPKTFLKFVESQSDRTGALMTPGGGLAIVKHNSDPFDKLSQSMQRKQTNQIPKELQCPICKNILKDAVTTACCGVNFCDHCILRAIYDDPNSCCPNCKKVKCSSKDLTPNQKIRSIIESKNQSINTETSYKPNYEKDTSSHRGPSSRGPSEDKERRRGSDRSTRHDPYSRSSNR